MNTVDFFLLNYCEQFDEHLTALQVQGMQRLLAALEKDPLMSDRRWWAYVLATTKHECANTWQPIKEWGGDAYFVKRYWTNTKVRRMLGNRSPDDAIRFCGRGYVQLSGYHNYLLFSDILRVDLVAQPDRALEHEIAYEIASIGLRHGVYTGKALRHYINATKCDYVGARRCVNGTDRAHKIAAYAKKFLICVTEDEAVAI